jgi:hypothetical protein
VLGKRGLHQAVFTVDVGVGHALSQLVIGFNLAQIWLIQLYSKFKNLLKINSLGVF